MIIKNSKRLLDHWRSTWRKRNTVTAGHRSREVQAIWYDDKVVLSDCPHDDKVVQILSDCPHSDNAVDWEVDTLAVTDQLAHTVNVAHFSLCPLVSEVSVTYSRTGASPSPPPSPSSPPCLQKHASKTLTPSPPIASRASSVSDRRPMKRRGFGAIFTDDTSSSPMSGAPEVRLVAGVSGGWSMFTSLTPGARGGGSVGACSPTPFHQQSSPYTHIYVSVNFSSS